MFASLVPRCQGRLLGLSEFDLLRTFCVRIVKLDLKVGKTRLQALGCLDSKISGFELLLRVAINDEGVTTCWKVGRRPDRCGSRRHRRSLRALLSHGESSKWGMLYNDPATQLFHELHEQGPDVCCVARHGDRSGTSCNGPSCSIEGKLRRSNYAGYIVVGCPDHYRRGGRRILFGSRRPLGGTV